jgi:hypothetical protein
MKLRKGSDGMERKSGALGTRELDSLGTEDELNPSPG